MICLYIPYSSDKTPLQSCLNQCRHPLFISHIVQIKLAIQTGEQLEDVSSFISHIVQIKQLEQDNVNEVEQALYPI